MLVRGKSCGKSSGMLLPQLTNDVRELAARLGITIRRSDITPRVQSLPNKVGDRLHAVSDAGGFRP
jgi:hypothetical protein